MADGNTRITIVHVAAEANVSVRTVSRVLNESPAVNEATRQLVRAVIDRLRFNPSSRARGLATGRSYLLGVVQDDPNTHSIGVFQRGIVDRCTAAGYELVVHSSAYGDERLVDDITKFVHRSRVDGLVLLPPISERDDLAMAMTRLGVPVVGIASVELPSYRAMLVSDERGGAEAAAEHLAVLGHRNIAIIKGRSHFQSTAQREQGFRAGLEKHGIALPPQNVRTGNYNFEDGLVAADELLNLAEPPTAIFATNDIMAAATYKAAYARGLAIPHELSVIGYDDADLASVLSPALTTVRRPLRHMAAEATNRLLNLIEGLGQSSSGDIKIQMTLIRRESTAGPRKAPL